MIYCDRAQMSDLSTTVGYEKMNRRLWSAMIKHGWLINGSPHNQSNLTEIKHGPLRSTIVHQE